MREPWPARRVPGRFRAAAALLAAFPWVYFAIVRPWHRRWGATDEDVRASLPGDELVPEPRYQHTRAITVRAPADHVWRWLVQIGQDRGGFYSYEWLENLAGVRVHSANRVHPEWQQVAVGDRINLLPGWGPRVLRVDSGRALVIEGWGAYVVRPIDAHTSRLIARGRIAKGAPALFYLLTMELQHFIMERKMLLGLKARAERSAKSSR